MPLIPVESNDSQPDLSDFDDGASSPVFTAPAASSTTSASWTAPISTPSINVSGHQRAALELRNLTLEREVDLPDYMSVEHVRATRSATTPVKSMCC